MRSFNAICAAGLGAAALFLSLPAKAQDYDDNGPYRHHWDHGWRHPDWDGGYRRHRDWDGGWRHRHHGDDEDGPRHGPGDRGDMGGRHGPDGGPGPGEHRRHFSPDDDQND